MTRVASGIEEIIAAHIGLSPLPSRVKRRQKSIQMMGMKPMKR